MPAQKNLHKLCTSPNSIVCGLSLNALTIISPSSGISRSLCLIIPLCATVPSDFSTQLSELFPNGILFKSHFFVASPTPHAPANQTPNGKEVKYDFQTFILSSLGFT